MQKKIPQNNSTIKQDIKKLSDKKHRFYSNAYLNSDTLEINFDSLIYDSRDNLFIPTIYTGKESINIKDKVLLAVFCLLLKECNHSIPLQGKILYGNKLKLTSVKIERLVPKAEKMVNEIYLIRNSQLNPDMFLNRNCDLCEFYRNCKLTAEKNDSLCLIRGITKKEIERLHKKGIFTVNQYSYTFRPRRRRNKNIKVKPFKPELKTLSIREKKIHVYDLPEVQSVKTSIFLDVEGMLSNSFYYLIGVIILDGKGKKHYSFWADSKKEEIGIFEKFLDILNKYEDFIIYHYGSYESKYFKKMVSNLPETKKQKAEAKLKKSCNLLALLYSNIYFPTYSNSLKDIANFLGFSWSSKNASGMQCILWREEWNESKDDKVKEIIIQYNYEDCLALLQLKNTITHISEKENQDDSKTGATDVVYCDNIKRSYVFKFLTREYALPEIETIHNFSLFDYQRQKVFVRTDEAVKRSEKRSKRHRKNNPRPNKKELITARVCQRCKSRNLKEVSRKYKRLIDLKFSDMGMKRLITQVDSYQYKCFSCNKSFVPKKYQAIGQKHLLHQYRKRSKYGHNLISWAMFQHIENKLSFRQIQYNFSEIFNMHVGKSSLHEFKKYTHYFYEKTFELLAEKILNSEVIYVDETPLKMKRETGYAWVFTNNKEIVSIYKPTREGEFLKEFLREFTGILVSDFYTSYDAINCTQQKCLIHLIRDMNDDLLKNPFDEQLKKITTNFTKVMQNIVQTIDSYGLKKRHLNKHKKEIESFYTKTITCEYSTETSQYYQTRFIKHKNKLFQFLNFDNVSWNNNNAERAIKLLATHSNRSINLFSPQRIDEYLKIMSIYQTCNYNNVSFLKFLLSREQNFDEYLRTVR
jgi:predicted RecB family nuclease